MASLKDLAGLTSQLDGLTTQLHSELTEGGIDFRKMVDLTDDIGAIADRLASGFTTMADALEASLDDQRDGGGSQDEES